MSTTKSTSTTALTDADGVKNFINGHVWIPVLASVVVFVIAVGSSYALCRLRRKRNQYDYTALEEDLAQSTLLQREKVQQKVEQRDTALLNCSFFLRSSGQYSMIDHLPEIGCRKNRQWFLVKNKEKPKEYILTIVPKGHDMILPFSTSTERNLNELFITLEHPYIYPVEDVAFQYDMEQLITMSPYNRKGSIKDYLYSSHCLDDWDVKYSVTGKPLTVPLASVRLYGRQVLEGLLFLKSKGFPYFGQLHSGNVILEDRVCRISGYENTLLSIPPKLMPLLKKYTLTDMKHFDVLSFGHLIYEMATGQELDTAIPESRHYLKIKHMELLEVLKYIFNVQGGAYPSIRRISQHEFFKEVRLSELVVYLPYQVTQPPGIKHLLKCIKRNSAVGKRKSYTSYIDESQPRPRLMSQGSEHSSQSSSSRTPSSSRTLSSRRSRSSQIVPLTPVLSSTQDQHKEQEEIPVFAPANDATEETEIRDVSELMQTSTPLKGKGKRNKSPNKRESIGMASETSSNLPEVSSEMTALLAEIKGRVPLKKAYTTSNFDSANV